MSFFLRKQEVPGLLETEEFALVPLTTAHATIDYEAVMGSRSMLRLWSGGPWPRDDFTLAENLVDLQYHQREHQERVAFTYTVLTPRQDICLGCLYMRPLAELADTNPGSLDDCQPGTIMARFWMRTSLVAQGLDRRLLTALRTWFASAWSLPQIYFHTREVHQQQVMLLEEAALPYRFSLEYPRRGGQHRFYLATPAHE